MSRGIPYIRRGQAISAGWLNRLVDAGNLANGLVPGPRQIDTGDTGTGPQEAAVPSSGNITDKFVITSAKTDA